MEILSIIFYLFLPIIICSIGFIFNKLNFKYNKLFQIILFSLLIGLIIGLRSKHVGNDTQSYFNFYDSLSALSLKESLKQGHFEKGFVILCFIFAKMKIPFILFNCIVSVFLTASVALCCFKLSKIPSLSIAIYICSGCFTLNMSSVRQTLAMGLCFSSIYLYSILKNKPVYIRLLQFVPLFFAVFIHKTSLAFLLVFLLMFIKPKKISYVVYFMLFSLVAILYLPSICTEILFSSIKVTETYSFFPPRATLSFSGTALLLYLLVIASFIIYSERKITIDLSLSRFKLLSKIDHSPLQNTTVEENSSIIFGMVLFEYLMYLGEQSVSLLARCGLYGGLGICILVPNLLCKVSKEEKHNFIFDFLILLFFIGYFAFTTLKDNYLNLIPYGVF